MKHFKRTCISKPRNNKFYGMTFKQKCNFERNSPGNAFEDEINSNLLGPPFNEITLKRQTDFQRKKFKCKRERERERVCVCVCERE